MEGGGGTGVARPTNLDDSVAVSEAWCEEASAVCVSPELALFESGLSADSMVSGVDLLRLEGEELETTMVFWPPLEDECPCPWLLR